MGLLAGYTLIVTELELDVEVVILCAIPFLLSALCACYWDGPYINGLLDQRPFRWVAIFLGVTEMGLWLGFAIIEGYHW